jgi:hypothetical protein
MRSPGIVSNHTVGARVAPGEIHWLFGEGRDEPT